MPADERPGSVDRAQFLSVVCPALTAGDAQGLADEVLRRWTPRQLCRLLADRSVDVRRVAAMVLGLVGDATCVGCLGRALHDADAGVNEMAEHGLWSIWFRSGKGCAAGAFAAGIAAMEQEAYAGAIGRFEEAARADGEFAEAYHQCAIAHFFLGQWRESIADCQRALDRMPTHFGAMAGMGHAYAQLGELDEALDCYRRALAIHPRLADVREAAERLETARAERALAELSRQAR